LVSVPAVTTAAEAAHGDDRRPAAGYRTDLVTVLLGLWFTVGLFLDAWAHNNVPQLETFFTPWHAVFYSGFVATAGWILWTVRRAGRSGRRSIPAGYGAAAVAVVGFSLAGIGDLLWHTVFGIEQNINILFSPTHLGLASAMLVIVTAPLRSAWADRSLPPAPGLRRLLPAVLSISLATTIVLLLVQYANVLTRDGATVLFGLSTVGDGFTERLVSSLFVTNLILIMPLLVLARRWVLPFGAATIGYAAVGGLSAAVTGFRNLDLIIAVIGAGIGVDLLARWVRPAPEQSIRLRVFAALAPLLTWTIYLATVLLHTPPPRIAPELGGGQPEPVVELYTGVPVVQALIGLLVAVLLTAGGYAYVNGSGARR
jgi:hypothetical protein